MTIPQPRPYIKVTDCGNTVLVKHCPFVPPEEPPVRRIDDAYYLVTSTAEVRRYAPRSRVKGDNLASVRKSFNRLKSLINANCEHPSHIRYVTLTYAENMTDNSRISKHMERFFSRMHGLYGDFEYIYVKERQARGAWHMHCVLFFPGEAPYMPSSDDDHPVRDAWGRGWVNVQGFRGSINNLGNYLCAYLTDDREASKKGARLANYESGIRLYNCSRGIRRPLERAVCYEDFVEFATRGDTLLLSEREGRFPASDLRSRTVISQIFAVV